MTTPIALTMGQQFEIERFNRAIDATEDTSELRSIAKQLLQAWHTQKAATKWVMAQQMGPSQSSCFSPSALHTDGAL
ncbi:MAG: hypothetical protein VKM98_01750 [Cyanobacteriota bacterium]|nr:hypothetical protein [Cyanobacteriota bacterium]